MTEQQPYVTLYGQKLSWYSTKVRSYLLFKGIDFFEQSPTLITYYGTIRRRFGDPAIPVVVTPDGEWLQDSSIIIENLEARYPQPSVIPATPVQHFAALLLELWADEFWHVAAVHTRWSYPEQNYPIWEAEMGRGFAPWLPRFLQRKLAAIPKKMMLDYLPQLGIVKEQVPLIDRWIEVQLDALNAHFATMPYLLGSRASIADFALFGPLDGHIYRDVSSRGPLIDSRPHLHAWIQRLSVRKPQPWPGEFLDADRLPATLEPIFRSIFDEMVPYLEGILREVQTILPTLGQGQRLPRFTPEVSFPFASGTHFRQGMPYALWMAQRILDQLKRMPENDAARVDSSIRSMGGERFLTLDIPRLRRVGLHAAPDSASA
jgi:glutathione S-transferase